MKADEGITGCIYTVDPSRCWVAGNPRALHHVQQDLGGQGYHMHNGAVVLCHPHYGYPGFFFFASGMFFGLFSAIIIFFLIFLSIT